MSALAFLAGLGGGYNEQTRYNNQKERQDKLDQITLDEAAARKGDRERARTDQDALRAAAAPVPVEPEVLQPLTPNDDDGNAMPVAPTGRYKAGPARFASEGLAQEAAGQQRDTNYAAALARIDPTKARAFQIDGIHVQQAQDEEKSRQFDNEIVKAASGGVEALVKFTNASKVSPTQSRFVPDPDGKAGSIQIQQPDGSWQPNGMRVSNDAAGAVRMATFLSQKMPIGEKLKHFQTDERLADDRAKTAGDNRYRDRMAGVAEQQADTNEEYRRDSLDVQRERNDAIAAGKGKAGASAYERMDEADKQTLGSINKQREAITAALLKATAESADGEDSPGMKKLRVQDRALGLRSQSILEKYGVQTTADPLGMRKPGAAPGAVQTGPNPMQGAPGAAPKPAASPAKVAAAGVAPPSPARDQQRAMRQDSAARIAATQPPVAVPQGQWEAPAAQAGGASGEWDQPSTLDQMQGQAMSTLAAINQSVQQARRQLQAAAKSNDPAALQRYAAALQEVSDARDRFAQQAFGNGAPRVLASLPE